MYSYFCYRDVYIRALGRERSAEYERVNGVSHARVNWTIPRLWRKRCRLDPSQVDPRRRDYLRFPLFLTSPCRSNGRHAFFFKFRKQISFCKRLPISQNIFHSTHAYMPYMPFWTNLYIIRMHTLLYQSLLCTYIISVMWKRGFGNVDYDVLIRAPSIFQIVICYIYLASNSGPCCCYKVYYIMTFRGTLRHFERVCAC